MAPPAEKAQLAVAARYTASGEEELLGAMGTVPWKMGGLIIWVIA